MGAAGYSGTPLATKLGIRPGTRALLVNAPALPALIVPPEATLHRRAGSGAYDVVLLFAGDSRGLGRFEQLAARLTVAGALWVCWPKRASGVPTDLDENVVRAHGLSNGLVDVKVAAIDEIWSGLKFVRRLADR
jgi:hypothetical protein